MFFRAGSSSGWEELMVATSCLETLPHLQGAQTLSSRSRVLGLASFPSPLAGWPHHEYAHSGLGHSQERRPPSSIGQAPWQPGRPPNIPPLIQWVLVRCSKLEIILRGLFHQHRHYPGILLVIFLRIKRHSLTTLDC